MKSLLIFVIIVLCCGLTSCSGEAKFLSTLSKATSLIEIQSFTAFIKLSLLFAAISIIIQLILSTFGIPFTGFISWIIIAFLIFMNDKMGFGMKAGFISSIIVLSISINLIFSLIWGKLFGKIMKI